MPAFAPTAQPATGAQVGAPATSAATQPQREERKSEHQLNKRIQDLFGGWKTKIDSQYKNFKSLGDKTIEVEKKSYESHRELQLLQEAVRKAEATHKSINEKLDSVSSEQQDLNRLLDDLEQQVDNALLQSGIQSNSVDERDNLYNKAKNVRANIDEVDQIVNDIVKVINDRHDRPESQGAGEEVEQTLSIYLETLNWAESGAIMLDARIKALEKEYKIRS